MSKTIIIPKIEEVKIFQRKLRTCAYCRVSSSDKDSIDSLENQKKYFEKEKEKHPDWNLVGVFYDEGISGTQFKNRPAFNEMLSRADNGEIDLIMTKEVSRFSRNLIDTLTIAQNLRARGIYIWFIDDFINTQSNRDMDTLVDIARQAQRESERTSKRVQWGQREKMEQGVVFGRNMLGYNVKDGQLIINEADVPVVKKIFDVYLKGDGTHAIAKKLREEGIVPKDPDGRARYKNDWSNTMILRVLRNEKYVGDLLQQKTYTTDPLSHSKKYNNGKRDMFFIKNHHEPIIDRETWDAVQAELKRRSPSEEQKSRHSNRYWCSGKVYCGVCGNKESYISRTKELKNGAVYKAWRCFQAAKFGSRKEVTINGETAKLGCTSESVNDKVLQAAIHSLIDFVIGNKDELKKQILDEIQQVSNTKIDTRKKTKDQKAITKFETEKTSLIRLLAKGKIKEKDYDKAMSEIEKEIESTKNSLDNIINIETINNRQINESQSYITELDKILAFDTSSYNELLYKEVTQKIVVYPNHILEVYLTCMPTPTILQYEATGKLELYKVEFNVKDKIEQA